MSRPVARVACAVAVDGEGVALGDPTGSHVLLTAHAVLHRRGAAEDRRVPWEEVDGVTVAAAPTRSARPARLAVLSGMAADLVGLEWTPTLAPVTVHLTQGDDAAELECDGYIGRGYWAPHLAALSASLHVLTAHGATRDVLRTPDRFIADVDAAAGEELAARGRLAATWGSRCDC